MKHTLYLAATAPYCYANGVYCAPAANGYTVVAPPGADSAEALPVFPPPHPPAAAASPAPEPIVYPRNGQSAVQTDNDRQDCQRWAAAQPNAGIDVQIASMLGRVPPSGAPDASMTSVVEVALGLAASLPPASG